MYELFLKYNAAMSIGVSEHWGDLCDQEWSDVMYWEGETDEEFNNEEDEGTKIGSLNWVYYNQALATVYGINMSQVNLMLFQYNNQALLELDCTRLSQETIDEIGAASNPNIVVLNHFAIEAAWRNKGFGEEVLKGFIEHMTGKCGYIVIVHNEPAQFGKRYSSSPKKIKERMSLERLEQDPEKAQYKLNAFWQRCGFRPFKNYDNVFICNVDRAVRNNLKAKAPAI